MNINDLIRQVCDEIRLSDSEPDVVATIANVLEKQGVDLRHEPSLKAMKRILVEAVRAANEWHCLPC